METMETNLSSSGWAVEHYQLKNIFRLVAPNGFKFSVSGIGGLLDLLEGLVRRGGVVTSYHGEVYELTPEGELVAFSPDPWENPTLNMQDVPTNAVSMAGAVKEAIKHYLESKNINVV